MIPVWKAFHASVERAGSILSARFCAKVKHKVLFAVVFVEEASHLGARVAVKMFETSRRKSMRDDARSHVGQIKEKPFSSNLRLALETFLLQMQQQQLHEQQQHEGHVGQLIQNRSQHPPLCAYHPAKGGRPPLKL